MHEGHESSKVDDPLERLINRQLDGELSPEEELELNKILIKHPTGRSLMEEYERNDHLAKMVLRASLSPEEFRPLLQAELPARSLWRPALWGLGAAGAVAAAAVILALGTSFFQPTMPGNVTTPPRLAGKPTTRIARVDEPNATTPGTKLEPVGRPMPLVPTRITGRRIERFLVPVITGDPAEENEVPVWQFERRREKLQLTSGEL